MSLTLSDATVSAAKVAAPSDVTFATFWAGRSLSGYEASCMASFVDQGYRLIAYSYEEIENLPDGVEPGDAASIVARDYLGRRHVARWLASDPHTGLTLLRVSPRAVGREIDPSP